MAPAHHVPRGFFLIAAHRESSDSSLNHVNFAELSPFRIYLKLRESSVRRNIRKKKEKRRRGNSRGINESEKIIDFSRQLSISPVRIACYYFQSGNDLDVSPIGYGIGANGKHFRGIIAINLLSA